MNICGFCEGNGRGNLHEAASPAISIDALNSRAISLTATTRQEAETRIHFSIRPAMSWQRNSLPPSSLRRSHYSRLCETAYVDGNLLGTGKINRAAIIGLVGGIWANSPDYNVRSLAPPPGTVADTLRCS